ncbi:MAG: hypothetical protein DRP42_06970 [Tenericutes bacterium]|nr:MAG: hypothetical protein DRP42_06970 [Mycoplasmatota bacterium]
MEGQEQTSGMLTGLTNPEQLSPQEKQEIDSYTTLMMDLIHNKATSNDIQDMLKSGEPSQTVPATAIQVNHMAEQTVKQSTGSMPSSAAKLGGSVYLVSDLIEVGNTSGIFNVQDEAQITQIYQDTLQQYIESGIKDGSIDPIELQQSVEPLLSQEQQETGMAIGQQAGVAPQPTNEMMNSQLMKGSAKAGAVGGQL